MTSAEARKKKLVMVIGPHHVDTAATEVFYYRHANLNPAPALADWTWPAQDGPLATAAPGNGRVVYKHLVDRAADEELQEELLTNIQAGWEQSKHGVIIANEEFDRIGDDLPSKLDGLGAMKRVVERLSVDRSNVEIALNYRLPRLEHWLSFWKHDSAKSQNKTYAAYICSGKHHKIWEALESSMNPLKLAETVREEGWKVNIVDMASVAAKNLDVAHVLGCDVLGVECENGWIQGLEDKTSSQAGESDGKSDLSLLDTKAQMELEAIFRYRDCHYQGLVDNNGVKILQDGSLSSILKNECDPTKHDIYKLLANSTFLYNALRTQFGCHDEWIDIAELLGMQDSTAAMANDSNTTKKDPVDNHEIDAALGEEEFVSKAIKSNNLGAKVAPPVLLLVVITMAGIYLLQKRRHQDIHQVVDLSAFEPDPIEDAVLA
jgi:hypothetical protein